MYDLSIHFERFPLFLFTHWTSSSPHPTEHALLNTPLSYPGAPPPVSFYPWHHDEDGGRRAEWLTRWDEWDEAYSSSSGTQRDLSQGLRGLQKAEDFLSKTFGTGHYNLHSCCCRNICTQMYILVYLKQSTFIKNLVNMSSLQYCGIKQLLVKASFSPGPW